MAARNHAIHARKLLGVHQPRHRIQRIGFCRSMRCHRRYVDSVYAFKVSWDSQARIHVVHPFDKGFRACLIVCSGRRDACVAGELGKLALGDRAVCAQHMRKDYGVCKAVWYAIAAPKLWAIPCTYPT